MKFLSHQSLLLHSKLKDDVHKLSSNDVALSVSAVCLDMTEVKAKFACKLSNMSSRD